MASEPVAAALTGGNPRSLGRADDVVARVLARQAMLDELFACLFDPDEVVRMRAADALEKVCRQRPDWLTPYIDGLLSDVALIDQPSVRWHLVQMLGEVTLRPQQRERALTVLWDCVDHASDWIVLNYSLEVLAGFVRQDPVLRERFVAVLLRHQLDPRKSVAKRAANLLAELSGG